MNEAQWQACNDPVKMIAWLEGDDGDNVMSVNRQRVASDRKYRLFVAACFRDVAPVCDPIGIGASREFAEWEEWADSGVRPVGRDGDTDWTASALTNAQGITGWCDYHRGDRTSDELKALHARLLRDIMGHPTQHYVLRIRRGDQLTMRGLRDGDGNTRLVRRGRNDPVNAVAWSNEDDKGMIQVAPVGDPASRATWTAPPHPFITASVTAIASSIYERRAWEELPQLADEMERCGCPTFWPEYEGNEILVGKECPYCAHWPKDSPMGDKGWVKCERWRPEEVQKGVHGQCGTCNRVWRPGYDTVRVMGIENPILRHFREEQKCSACQGKGQLEVRYTLSELMQERDPYKRHIIEFGPEPRYMTCPKCWGKKGAIHTRGCWALDEILRKF